MAIVSSLLNRIVSYDMMSSFFDGLFLIDY
jgi:hypothetical protein